VNLLIGQDVPEAIVPLEVRRGEESDPVFSVRTRLGWTLNGKIGGRPMKNSAVCNFLRADLPGDVTHDRVLEAQVENFWHLDTCQNLADSSTQMSQEDKKVIGIWDKSVELIDGHYQLEIPFDNASTGLPNNRVIAEKRLGSLGKITSQKQDENGTSHITTSCVSST
jgi:hypothetical protein